MKKLVSIMAVAAFMLSMNVNAQEPRKKQKKKQLKLKNLAQLLTKSLVVQKLNQVDVVHLKKLLRKKLNNFIQNKFRTPRYFRGVFLCNKCC